MTFTFVFYFRFSIVVDLFKYKKLNAIDQKFSTIGFHNKQLFNCYKRAYDMKRRRTIKDARDVLRNMKYQ